MTSPENTPVVSVIMPVYNGMATLERAVRSLQAQTFADWELLVVDDCSTDGSREAVAAWAAADPRIRPLRNAENRGPGAARNLGLRSARGEFIAYLDGDDEYDPQYLEHVARLRDKGDVLVFGYDFVYEDERDGKKGTGPICPEAKGTVPDQPSVGARLRENRDSPPASTWHPEEHSHRLFATNIVIPLGIAHRREWIDKLGGFNELVNPDEDWDFVRRLARAGARFAFFPLKSGRYYIRSTSRSRRPRLLPWQRETLERNWRAGRPMRCVWWRVSRSVDAPTGMESVAHRVLAARPQSRRDASATTVLYASATMASILAMADVLTIPPPERLKYLIRGLGLWFPGEER